MKKRAIILALTAIVGASCFTACGDNDKRVVFEDTWKKGGTLAAGEKINETLTYDVTFEKGESLKYGYECATGTFTATLVSNGDAEDTYTYTSTLKIPVTYTLDDKEERFDDEVITTVKFYNADDFLAPIYSEKTVVSRSPAYLDKKPSNVDKCYTHYDYTIKTTYKDDDSATKEPRYEVEYRKTADVDAKTVTGTFSRGSKYSYIDNEQLLVALRAVPSDTKSGSFRAFYPTNDTRERIKFSFDSKETKEFNHTVNGVKLENNKISYRPVTFKYAGANPGATQTAWFATTTSATNNEHRNVMLRMEVPVYHNVGTFVYELKSAVYN